MHKILKLQHHQHTGKVLPHHHTSYRALGLLMAVVGIYLLFVGHVAGADPLFITAKKSAPIPVEPAVILVPLDGFTTSEGVIEVSGNCPSATPPNIVVILEDGTAIGSTPCLATDTFSTTVTLRSGARTLSAQIYNITNDAGPVGTPITVTYTPQQPTPPTKPTSPTTPQPPTPDPDAPSAPTTSDLAITTKTPFFVYGPNKPVSWTGIITGGIPPYSLTIEWGDGSHSTQTITDSRQYTYTHRYETIETFYINATVTDSVGATYTNIYAGVSPYIQKNQTDFNAPSGLQFLLPNMSDYTRSLLFSLYALTVLTVGLLWFDARYIRPYKHATVRITQPTRKPIRKHSTQRIRAKANAKKR